MAFYAPVERWTSEYAASKGYFSSYGHEFVPPKVVELLKFDGAVMIRDGVLGGSNGNIHRRWKPGNSMFDSYIADAITNTWWRQLKSVYKICLNSCEESQRTSNLYDPAYKFRYIFDVIVHNTNQITEEASLDLCGDETTWGFNGFGERGAGLLTHILNKPGVTKGGQVVLLTDVDHF